MLARLAAASLTSANEVNRIGAVETAVQPACMAPGEGTAATSAALPPRSLRGQLVHEAATGKANLLVPENLPVKEREDAGLHSLLLSPE